MIERVLKRQAATAWMAGTCTHLIPAAVTAWNRGWDYALNAENMVRIGPYDVIAGMCARLHGLLPIDDADLEVLRKALEQGVCDGIDYRMGQAAAQN